MGFLNINNCRKCDLSIYRKHIVEGEGLITADIMIIGEAPGYKEDKLGKPFVGKSGKYLNFMLKQCNIKRGNLYITNVVKCKPFANKKPLPIQINKCKPNLQDEINMVKPKLIILLGNTAKETVLKINTPLIKLIDTLFVDVNGTYIYATYHPSFILRREEYMFYDEIWKKIYKIMIKLIYPNYEIVHGAAPINETRFYTLYPR